MTEWVSGSRGPIVAIKRPPDWLLTEQIICVFHLNQLLDKMALHEVSRIFLPVLLCDLAWERPVSFQLGFLSLLILSNPPLFQLMASVLCDSYLPYMQDICGLTEDFCFLLGIIYHCDLTKEELEPRVFREVTVKGIDASDYQTVQVWRSICS